MAKVSFSNAKTIAAPAPKTSKARVDEINTPGLKRLAAIQAAIATLTTLASVEETAIKSGMSAHFLAKGTQAKDRPANYKGIDGEATGSMQLKIRSSASIPSPEDRVILAKYGIPLETVVKTPEAFMINPIYTNDMALLAKVEEALAEIELPDDFLMKQEEVSAKVVTEESMKTVFNKPIADAEILLPLVSTLAIKASIEGDFWSILDSIMKPEAEAKAA